jgi:hypothetical protein
MKTLIKRLFGITKLENELIGTCAELEATNLALITMRHQLRALRESMAPQEGPWKQRKDGKGWYRRIKHPLCLPGWTTESVSSLPDYDDDFAGQPADYFREDAEH